MKPLVTIAVATYQSAPYVVETLESIYRQTYDNLALVISDDCSTDKTLQLVNDWVAQEKVQTRFASIQVITVPKNTGVSANCNRCVAALPSDWFKFIAGDDILLPNCIADNMEFVHENSQAKIVFSQIKLYENDFKEQHYLRTTPAIFPSNLMDAAVTAEDQYQLLLVLDRIHYTPSVFINKQAIIEVGGYDESNHLVEDYPMWLQLTGSGVRLYYFHKITVGYRVHAKATNNVGDSGLFKPSVLNTFIIRKKYAHPFLPWDMVLSEQVVHWVSLLFQYLGWNKNRAPYRFMYRFGCFYSNPFHYIFALKKRLPTHKNNLFYH